MLNTEGRFGENCYFIDETLYSFLSRVRLKCDGTRAETRFRLSTKRTNPFKSAGASVQSTTGSRGVRISGGYAGYTMFRGSVNGTATYRIRQFPLHYPSFASPCVNWALLLTMGFRQIRLYSHLWLATIGLASSSY